MIPSDPEVLVIGAGAAGVAAARALRDMGRSCAVLEAGPRPGGRARTVDAWGAPLDLGATWLHQAHDNPLTPHAGPALDHDTVRERLLHLGDRWATDAERRDYAARLDAFEDAIAAAYDPAAPDRDAASVAPRGGRWDATIAHWLGAQINAAELAHMSLADYCEAGLDGPNLLPRGGVGGIVGRLAEGLPVAFSAPVETLRWGGPGVVAEGAFGTLRARSAIVTVSTGVLASGAIRFDPPLPAATLGAAESLPLGLLTKVAFRAREGAGRLGVAPFHSARLAVREGAAPPFGWIFWPWERDHLYGFLGGEGAWALAAEGPAALEAAARDDLRTLFGREADAVLGEAILTDWGTDPLFRGSYSHARPGRLAAREVLAAPLAGGRLLFAGEACHVRFAGTVAGAWCSGERAAGLAA